MLNFSQHGYLIIFTLILIEWLDGARILKEAGNSEVESNRGGVSRPVPTDGRVCDYQCEESGGCYVKYVGPSRDGKIQGSCASVFFGGVCLGTPPECLDCNKALHCTATNPSEGAVTETSHTVDRDMVAVTETSHTVDRDMCQYTCKSNGGCQAKFKGPFRTGPYSGSCAPPSFGQKCVGIPPECGSTCHTFCPNSSEPSDEHSGTQSQDVSPGLLDETLQAKDVGLNLVVSTHMDDRCEYKCKSDGGCTAKYLGDFRSGPLLGSCAPPSFGGKCLGIPRECESSCLSFCSGDQPAIIPRLL